MFEWSWFLLATCQSQDWILPGMWGRDLIRYQSALRLNSLNIPSDSRFYTTLVTCYATRSVQWDFHYSWWNKNRWLMQVIFYWLKFLIQKWGTYEIINIMWISQIKTICTERGGEWGEETNTEKTRESCSRWWEVRGNNLRSLVMQSLQGLMTGSCLQRRSRPRGSLLWTLPACVGARGTWGRPSQGSREGRSLQSWAGSWGWIHEVDN